MSVVRAIIEATLGAATRAIGSIPFEYARWLTLALLIVPMLLCWLQRRESIYRGLDHGGRLRDLRLWATAITLPYVLIYLLA